jgi:hypothetical protein
MLANENSRLRAQKNAPVTAEDIDDGDDDDDDDDEDEIEEELGFISPLDSVNAYQTFKQALTSASICFIPLLLMAHDHI